MSLDNYPESFAESSREDLIRAIIDGFRRTIIHYGLWYREVEHQLGADQARHLEAQAGERAGEIILKRLAELLGFELKDGVPLALTKKTDDELRALLRGVAVNWLVNDGVWFQTVENQFGMAKAKSCNDTTWSRFSPYEAQRIKTLLGLPERPGLTGLKAALGFRLYAVINKQSIANINQHSFIFRMNECRVQVARKRKGLDDYPCKSGGLVEYSTFAATIDPRIKTECVACPPDAHPDDWYCAWKFTLNE